MEVDRFEKLMEQTFTGVKMKGDRVIQSFQMNGKNPMGTGYYR